MNAHQLLKIFNILPCFRVYRKFDRANFFKKWVSLNARSCRPRRISQIFCSLTVEEVARRAWTRPSSIWKNVISVGSGEWFICRVRQFSSFEFQGLDEEDIQRSQEHSRWKYFWPVESASVFWNLRGPKSETSLFKGCEIQNCYFKGCELFFGSKIRGAKYGMEIKGYEKNRQKFKGYEKISQKFKGSEKNGQPRKKCSRWVPTWINVPPLNTFILALWV